MAITLKEALERHEETMQEYEALKAKHRKLKLEKVTAEIDDVIRFRIKEIMERPITYTPITERAWEVWDEVQALYPDFTFYFEVYARHRIDIKLAHKDWDWKGYGIKEIKNEEPEPTKSIWQIFKERYL